MQVVLPSKRERYTARLCWNSNKWSFPSGDAQHLETRSYVVDAGFGHEEWLLNFTWLIDGFHYGFLQPVNKSFDNVTGKTIDVLLYAINPANDRVYVGEIWNCEVLQVDQAKEALKEYRKRGWLKSMVNQVGKVGGKTEYLINERNATTLFNVRFRQEHVDIYDPPVLAERQDAVWSRHRYTLAVAEDKVNEQWHRKGKATPPSIRVISRKGTPAITYDPFHKRLQAGLLKLFEVRYGKGNVVLEGNNVDITIRDKSKTILIEIKTDSNPRSAIREAVGQLMEYAYYRSPVVACPVSLFIVAPGRLDKAAEQYIRRLRSEFNLPISYCSYSEGDPLPGVFEMPKR